MSQFMTIGKRSQFLPILQLTSNYPTLEITPTVFVAFLVQRFETFEEDTGKTVLQLHVKLWHTKLSYTLTKK